MSIPMAAPDILDREFLGIRARLLEVAASLDRIDRAEGNTSDDRRLALIRQALDVLLSPAGDRAEQVQLLFSRQYDDDWQRKFDIT
jgi:hypothetical protein